MTKAEMEATIEALIEALSECITEPAATSFEHRVSNPEYMDRRLDFINYTARQAIAKATGEAS